jgi:hypothetical protein
MVSQQHTTEKPLTLSSVAVCHGEHNIAPIYFSKGVLVWMFRGISSINETISIPCRKMCMTLLNI